MDHIVTALISGIVGVFLGLLTLAGGVWARSSDQKQANRRPFLERQLALCFEAADICSRLATETDLAEWEKARTAFWRIYWGPLCIVEDPDVEDAMIEFGKRVPQPGFAPPSLPMPQLEDFSYDVAKAARELVLKSWHVDLPELEDARKAVRA